MEAMQNVKRYVVIFSVPLISAVILGIMVHLG